MIALLLLLPLVHRSTSAIIVPSSTQFTLNGTSELGVGNGGGGGVLQIGLHDVNRDGTADVLWTDESLGVFLCEVRPAVTTAACLTVTRLTTLVAKFAFFHNPTATASSSVSALELAFLQRTAQSGTLARTLLFAHLVRSAGPGGTPTLVVRAMHMVLSEYDADIHALDIDRDDRCDFLHAFVADQTKLWAKNLGLDGTSGRATFAFQNHNFDGPLRPYDYASGTADVWNRQILQTFAYQYLYTRWFNTSIPAYAQKSWPPIPAQDKCCKQCVEPCATSYHDPCSGGETPCDKSCVCEGSSGQFNIPLRAFPQCGLWAPTFHLWLDCDNDQFSDVVIACNHDTPRVYRNDRLGNFDELLGWAEGAPDDITGGDVIDVNEDGFIDIVVTWTAGDDNARVTLMINDGFCSFRPIAAQLPPIAAPVSVAVSDVNGDGADDLLLVGAKVRTLINRRPAERGDSLTVLLRDAVNGVTPWGARVSLYDADSQSAVPFAAYQVNPSRGQVKIDGERKTFFWRAGAHRFVNVVAQLPTARNINVTLIGVPVGTKAVTLAADRGAGGRFDSSVVFFAPPPPAVALTVVAGFDNSASGALVFNITGVANAPPGAIYQFSITINDATSTPLALRATSGKIAEISQGTDSKVTGRADLNLLATLSLTSAVTREQLTTKEPGFAVNVKIMPAVALDRQASTSWSGIVMPLTMAGTTTSSTPTPSTSAVSNSDGIDATPLTSIAASDSSIESTNVSVPITASEFTTGVSVDVAESSSSGAGDQIVGDAGVVAGLDWWLWIVIGAVGMLLLIALIVGIVVAVRRRAASAPSSTTPAAGQSEIAMPELATSSTMMPPPPGPANYATVPRSSGLPAGVLSYEAVPAIPPPLAAHYEMANMPHMDQFHSFRNDSFRNESDSGRNYSTLPSSSDNSVTSYMPLQAWR
jgi:hypothetical protein